jgi:20S proteasome subunit alpha 6
LLIGAIDEAGTHIFETDPSGNYFEYVSMAIGDRNQSAKTYLEKHFATFANIGLEDLIKHGIAALRASAQDTELTEHNVSVGIVGGDSYKQLSKAEIRAQLGAGNGDVEMMQQ